MIEFERYLVEYEVMKRNSCHGNARFSSLRASNGRFFAIIEVVRGFI